MRKYLSFFRMRFIHGLQYRAAALSGVFTQFVWGAMEILLFQAFYAADAGQFPMSFQALANYVWLQQAFLALYMTWFWEEELFSSITTGNVAYELCRPANLYSMWFARGLAVRLSKALLRCGPILIIAMLLPRPYGLTFPPDMVTAACTLISMVLGLLVVVSINMIVYMTVFFTISSQGIKLIVSNLADFLSGSVIPIPFLPVGVGAAVSLLPFASIQNVPFRIYSGDIVGNALWESLALQLFWILVLVLIGKSIEQRALGRTVIQGG